MSDHIEGANAHPEIPAKTFAWVWICLVLITGIEVYLAYIELEPTLMLGILLGLSLIKAALIMAWFMHLKYEKRSLTLAIVPSILFCIGMMTVYILWDAVRLARMRAL
jgi:cytochrome c oxidase subunit 4